MDDLTGKISLFLKIRKVMVYSSLLLGLFLIIFLKTHLGLATLLLLINGFSLCYDLLTDRKKERLIKTCHRLRETSGRSKAYLFLGITLLFVLFIKLILLIILIIYT